MKYRTVRTSKYLILSNETLHLLNTDTDRDISEYLKFGPERLKESKIEEIESEQTVKIYNDTESKSIKSYKLFLATDDKPIELVISSRLVFAGTTETDDGISMFTNIFSLDNKNFISEVIVANQFSQKIGDLYPNLKVDLTINKIEKIIT